MSVPRLRPVGERGFLAVFTPEIDPALSARVRGLADHVAALPEVAEAVPGFCTVLVILREDADRSRLLPRLQEALAGAVPAAGVGTLVTVPVAYGGSAGPDLADVAHSAGRSEDEVVARHHAPEYLVYMVGFAPGFPYLGVLPEVLRLPRRQTPRTRVRAGSVAIADRLTGIYPLETPGGWHLIGWTPLRLFDPAKDPPALCSPGDRVRFEPGVEASREQAAASASQPMPVSEPRRPVLGIRAPGFLATVQDGGRRGYRRLGVPWSGPMDSRYHALANRRAGNAADAAALEMAWPPPVVEAFEEVLCGFAGPGWQVAVDGRRADDEGPLLLRRGQVLEFHRRGDTLWAYLAVAGGIDVPPILGSRATYLRGGFGGLGRTVRGGDALGRGEEAERPRRLPSPIEPPEDPLVVRLIPGPQDASFTEEGFQRLLSEVYTVTPSIDRTGYRLAGPRIEHAAPPEILPEGALPGVIQVPGDGQPIVLMADGPTTGGYPKIATVAGPDLSRLAQAAPGTRVRFRAVTVTDLQREHG